MVDCSTKLPYICKLDKEKGKGNGLFVGNCSAGWDQYNDKCYKFFSKKRQSWSEGRQTCIAYGGDLATIENYGVQKHLEYLTRDHTERAWIGITLTANVFVYV